MGVNNKMKSIKPSGPFTNGIYELKNPEKYKSIDKTVIYRSSLELEFCRICDSSPKIISWASEPFAIEYKHPFKKDKNNKPVINNYYPDFYVEMNEPSGIKKYIIETKPASFIDIPSPLAPNASAQARRNYNYKLRTIIVNRVKAKAANEYALKRGWLFQFITESWIIKNKLK